MILPALNKLFAEDGGSCAIQNFEANASRVLFKPVIKLLNPIFSVTVPAS
jgi:hypothetical protein